MNPSVQQAIAAFDPQLPLAVALSGGADSTALLLACHEQWPGRVRAVHVHHGLQAAADDFEQHCVQLCAQLDVPLVVQRVSAGHASGESPEDAARKARYRALTSAVAKNWLDEPVRGIALAQHADDQVETLLLALSRGAGLPGMSAMPARLQRDGVTFHRPLLGVSAVAIRAWLRARGQGWADDPSNRDERYTRNRIRARLLPALDAAFPQFRETFARSASHAADAQLLLTEMATSDLIACGTPPCIKSLQELSRQRQANVLRHWLRVVHGAIPSSAQLVELLNQVQACTTRGHKLNIRVGHGFIWRERDQIEWKPGGSIEG